MRRSMLGMLVALAALSTPLAAQASWAIGLAATLGGGWQIEGVDFGLGQRVRAGPIQSVGFAARFGSFIDEGAILGGSRGFVSALALSARTGRLELAQIGPENNVTGLGFDLTFEVSGYLGSHSPLPQGGRWAALSVLPGLRVGNPGGGQLGILIGPTVFLGRPTDVHGFLAVRFEQPLARR